MRATKARLSFRWGTGDELLVWSGPARTERREESKKVASKVVTACRWTRVDSRKLFAEAHGVFVSLQRRKNECNALELRTELIRSSRHYRALLRAQALHFPQTNESAEQLAEIKLLRTAELVWHLCEIFFVSSKPGTIITSQIVEWLQAHLDVLDPDPLAVSVANLQRIGERSPGYWLQIHRLLLRGQIQEARELLSRHSQRELLVLDGSPLFHIIDLLLDAMPRYDGSLSVPVFLNAWTQWQEDVRSFAAKMESDGSDTAEGIEKIFAILSGSTDALQELCPTWLSLLVAQILFSQPTLKSFELRYLVERCVKSKPPTSVLQSILVDIVNCEIYKAIGACWRMFGWWRLLPHLVHLLHLAGHVPDVPLRWGGDLVEYYLVENAVGIVSANPAQWRIAIDYLLHCPLSGAALMALIVERQPLDSQMKASKLLHVCTIYNMPDVARTMQRVLARQSSACKNYGQALAWYSTAGHASRLSQLVAWLCDHLPRPSIGKDVGWLAPANEPSPSGLTTSVDFLRAYSQLVGLWKQPELSEIVSQTLKIVAMDGPSPHFLWGLLFDLLPLLEANENNLLTATEVQQLMTCVEEMWLSHQKSLSLVEGVNPESQLRRLRMVLSQHLAGALFQT